jgi:hypothetical protein
MKKKSDTQMAFLDLMLCAIGCALMIFTAQIPQPRGRGRGWDDRPLVIHAHATGPRNARYTWELSREGGDKGPRAGGAATVTVTPAGRETENGQSVLFVVPEAEFGRWKLSVTARTAPNGLESLVGELRGSGVLSPRADKALDAHKAAYARYLALVGGRAPSDKLEALLSDLRAAAQGPAAEVSTGFGITEARPHANAYLKARRLLMQAVILEKLYPGPPNAERLRAEQELKAHLAGLEAAARRGGAPSVVLGLLVDAELRDPGARRDGKAWRDLNDALARQTRRPTTTPVPNETYLAYISELIRLRAVEEHLTAEDKDRLPDYRPRLSNYKDFFKATLAEGRSDPLLWIVAGELESLGQGDVPVEARYGVVWGDKKYPAVAEGAARDDKTEAQRLAPRDLNRPVALAAITLRKDNDRPLVVPEGR